MQYIDLKPLGKRTSRIGLGCGRLVGRSSLRDSAKIIELALKLGIRYFDVAPSYGMGTAEEVIGAVIGNSNQIAVATKVGIPRPLYSAKANFVRRLSKPILDNLLPLKWITLKYYMRPKIATFTREPFSFSYEAIRTSLQESLKKLRRNFVDVYLAHEPNPANFCESMEQCFIDLRKSGLITAYGVGVGAAEDAWVRFGSIWQSRWPDEEQKKYKHDVTYIWHGAIRRQSQLRTMAKPVHPGTLVRKVLEQSPDSILLVSCSTATHLKELLQEI